MIPYHPVYPNPEKFWSPARDRRSHELARRRRPDRLDVAAPEHARGRPAVHGVDDAPRRWPAADGAAAARAPAARDGDGRVAGGEGADAVCRLLRGEGAHGGGVVAGGAVRRPDAALLQRGDEPVQADLRRPGGARLRAGEAAARRQLAEVHPRRRQAQRPRGRRDGHVPPHVLRDARQLVVRRLLQEGRRRVGVGAHDGGVRAAARPLLRHLLRGRREARPRAGRRGARAVAAVPAARARPPRQREGQLLGDGRHRALRAVLGDPLRPHRRPRRREPGEHGRPRRARGVEPGVHAVQPRAERRAPAAPRQGRRHGHGLRAPRLDFAGTSDRRARRRRRRRRRCRHHHHHHHHLSPLTAPPSPLPRTCAPTTTPTSSIRSSRRSKR